MIFVWHQTTFKKVLSKFGCIWGLMVFTNVSVTRDDSLLQGWSCPPVGEPVSLNGFQGCWELKPRRSLGTHQADCGAPPLWLSVYCVIIALSNQPAPAQRDYPPFYTACSTTPTSQEVSHWDNIDNIFICIALFKTEVTKCFTGWKQKAIKQLKKVRKTKQENTGKIFGKKLITELLQKGLLVKKMCL